ncbi:hypothetical protein GRI97_08225 [Altererythrobacter xixiisoli]|uniref:HIRAN domain-containing protein n=1 Tax=Croceibacterium xixiisoli TaxID=1476466 RepID=A0A6I4TXB9_9SPHN|nr:HIRAN domain-containing protein [Croceibacterium xixiisoli]MXO98973.1 hypothetical protein [Croceibacterium xixiisoli]
MLPSLSLMVVGADYPNKKGPGRRFEIAMCLPGEPVYLKPEPKNPADPSAVAVYSFRGIQIGYLSAERCGRIGALIRQGVEIIAIFQDQAPYGAIIRAAFEGAKPVLPPPPTPQPHVSTHRPKTAVRNPRKLADEAVDPDPDFWPDETYPDE